MQLSDGWNGPLAVAVRECRDPSELSLGQKMHVKLLQHLDRMTCWRKIIETIREWVNMSGHPFHKAIAFDNKIVRSSHKSRLDYNWNDCRYNGRQTEQQLYSRDVLWLNEERILGVVYGILHEANAKNQPRVYYRVIYWIMRSGYTEALRWLIECGFQMDDIDNIDDILTSPSQNKSMVELIKKKMPNPPKFTLSGGLLNFKQFKLLAETEMLGPWSLRPSSFLADEELVELASMGYTPWYFPDLCLRSDKHPLCLDFLHSKGAFLDPHFWLGSFTPGTWCKFAVQRLLDLGFPTTHLSSLIPGSVEDAEWLMQRGVYPGKDAFATMLSDFRNYYAAVRRILHHIPTGETRPLLQNSELMYMILSTAHARHADCNFHGGKKNANYVGALWLIQEGAEVSHALQRICENDPEDFWKSLFEKI